MCKHTIMSIKRISATILFLFYAGNLVAQSHQDWTYNLGMYEVNVRQYSTTGTFQAVTDDLDRIDSLGVGILWMMPIHPIGQQNRLGSLGSYYSVQDYTGVNSEFGTFGDFKTLVDSAHARGLYVIMDWVANHTSWDNPLTETNPNWYAKNNQGEFIPPPGTNWSDVIQLDHSKPGLRNYMIDALNFWVDSAGVDGFRFDAVSFVPIDFWQLVLDSLKQNKPDIFLLAEGDGQQFHEAGFHQTFSWGFYGFDGGVIKRIADGGANAGSLEAFMATEKQYYRDGNSRLYFTSNHDENSWYGTPVELFGSAAGVFDVLTHTINGMPLIYNGEEAGMAKRLAFFDKDVIPWRAHTNFERFRRLLELRKRNSALWSGINANYYTRIYTNQNLNIHGFYRSNGTHRVLVFANLSATDQTFRTSTESYAGHFTNIFTGVDTTLAGRDTLTLPAWGYLVFEGSEPTTNSEPERINSAKQFNLKQNYPNPFNPTTTIHFQMPEAGEVRLEVFDATGRMVEQLTNRVVGAGDHSVFVQASHLASGIYIYRLSTPWGVQSKTMLLIK